MTAFIKVKLERNQMDIYIKRPYKILQYLYETGEGCSTLLISHVNFCARACPILYEYISSLSLLNLSSDLHAKLKLFANPTNFR